MDLIEDVQLVDKNNIAWAQKLLKDTCNITAEPAGAAALAIAHKATFQEYHRGQTVVFVVTGDNE